MMQLTLYQLIQYVRDGETDPGLTAALRADPDIDRRLRQARFICKMIGRQDKPAADPWSESSSVARLGVEYAASERRELPFQVSEPVTDTQYRSELRAPSEPEEEEQIPEIRKMVLGSKLSGQSLGVLAVSEKDGSLELSLQPALENKQTASVDICIDVDRYSIATAARLSPTEPLQLRFTRRPEDVAFTGLDVLFMPESGPFFRQSTNRDGVFEMPLGFTSGMLRISDHELAFLQIAREK
jgi:hypothetical protein